MVFVSHEGTPAAVLQALRDQGLEVSPFSLYRGGRETRGSIFNADYDVVFDIARRADERIDHYDTYATGIEGIPGMTFLDDTGGDGEFYAAAVEEAEPEDDDDPFDEDRRVAWVPNPVALPVIEGESIGDRIGRLERARTRVISEAVEQGIYSEATATDLRAAPSRWRATNNRQEYARLLEESIIGIDNAIDEREAEATPTPSPLDQALDQAHTVVMDRVQPTDREEEGGRNSVRKETWVGWDYSEFRPIFKQFADKIGRPVSVFVPHGYSVPDYQPGETLDQSRMNLFIYSAPGQEARGPRIVSALGHDLRLNAEAMYGQRIETNYAAALLGRVDSGFDSQGNEFPLAWVFDDAIFISVDVVHYPEDKPALESILDVAATLYGEDEDERRERRERIVREALERQATMYAEVVQRRAHTELDRLKRELEGLDQAIERQTRELVQNRRQYNNVSKQIVGFDDSAPDPEVFKREFLQLIGLRKVKRAEMAEDQAVLSIWTENLYALDDRTDEWHDIGEFRIVIDAENRTVRWHNLTRSVNGLNQNMQAPHVYSDGRACMGNFSEIAMPLLEQWELANLASMSIAFVENANTDDAAGIHVSKWPTVTEETATRFEN